MWKSIHLLLLSVLVFGVACSKDKDTATPNMPDRYAGNLYTDIEVQTDITYGTNQTQAGTTQNLELDFYHPANDNAAKRPLILLAPGGSFVTLNFPAMDQLARYLAKSGYAVGIVTYRLLDVAPSLTTILTTAVQARADLKAAVRFFYKDAASTNSFRIDTTNIFIGGHSAGAITAIHSAYISDTSELNAALKMLIMANGGLEGNSGNAGFSSNVRGVINLSGAIFDPRYINANEPIHYAIHGDADTVVPYGQGNTNQSNGNVPVFGSAALHNAAVQIGVKSELKTLTGGNHSAPVNPADCPDCNQSIVDFLYENLN